MWDAPKNTPVLDWMATSSEASETGHAVKTQCLGYVIQILDVLASEQVHRHFAATANERQ